MPKKPALPDPQEIAEGLGRAIGELEEIIGQIELNGPLNSFCRRVSVAKQILIELHELAASAGNPPGGMIQEDKNYVTHTKRKGKATQAAAVAFILKRYSETGGLVPISAKEIAEGTPEIQSQTNVYTTLSKLVHDGKLISYRKFGFGGYLPTKILLDEVSQSGGVFIPT